jgi:heme A synthase
LTTWWASGGSHLQLRGQGAKALTYWVMVTGMFLLGVSGAITALGDTLTITGRISPQENALVATFVELRIFHPLIAFVVFGLSVLAVWVAHRSGSPDARVDRYGQSIIILFVVQLLLGALNVQLKAPLWLQMVHLLVTSLIWLMVVRFGAALLARRAQAVERRPADLLDVTVSS